MDSYGTCSYCGTELAWDYWCERCKDYDYSQIPREETSGDEDYS